MTGNTCTSSPETPNSLTTVARQCGLKVTFVLFAIAGLLLLCGYAYDNRAAIALRISEMWAALMGVLSLNGSFWVAVMVEAAALSTFAWARCVRHVLRKTGQPKLMLRLTLASAAAGVLFVLAYFAMLSTFSDVAILSTYQKLAVLTATAVFATSIIITVAFFISLVVMSEE